MKNYVICFSCNNKDIVSMFNYIFYKGLSKSNYTDYIMYNTDVPSFMKDRVLDYNDLKSNLFKDLFCINFNENTKNDWYDFQNHKCIKEKEILLENERIYNSQLFNLTDINSKLGFPINFPIIRISELQKVYERSINELYGDLLIYNLINKANDISIGKGICLITGVNNINDVMLIKQSFPLRGYIIGEEDSEIICDYKIEKELLLSNNKFKLFYKLQTIIKFILI